MTKWTPEQKIAFLRGYHCRMGHTPGTPFEEATLSMDTGRSFNLYKMSEILELIEHLKLQATLDCLSVTDKFVLGMLNSCGIIHALCNMELCESENNFTFDE